MALLTVIGVPLAALTAVTVPPLLASVAGDHSEPSLFNTWPEAAAAALTGAPCKPLTVRLEKLPETSPPALLVVPSFALKAAQSEEAR